MIQPEIVVRAPAKINLLLAVGQVGSDGYHPVVSVYHAVGLYQRVAGRVSRRTTLTYVSGPDTVDTSGLGAGEDNLAVRAVRLLAATAEVTDGIELQISKRVPIAAGLAGGSADAAGALVVANALWQTGLSQSELEVLAAALGADVPFAMAGGTCVGTGRGEQLTQVDVGGELWWVLIFADFALSTPEVYATFDRLASERVADESGPDRAQQVLAALETGSPEALADAVANDLQEPALRMAPALAETLAAANRCGALAAFVSGSGPTVVALASDRQHADSLQGALTAAGYHAVTAPGHVSGPRFAVR